MLRHFLTALPTQLLLMWAALCFIQQSRWRLKWILWGNKPVECWPHLWLLLSMKHFLLQEVVSCLQALVLHKSLCNDKHRTFCTSQTNVVHFEHERSDTNNRSKQTRGSKLRQLLKRNVMFTWGPPGAAGCWWSWWTDETRLTGHEALLSCVVDTEPSGVTKSTLRWDRRAEAGPRT